MSLRLARSVFALLIFTAAVAVARSGFANRVQRIADAITELDVEGAERLLRSTELEGPGIDYQRARLAIYRGDCDAAAAILGSPRLKATPEGNQLAEIANGCAGATAGAKLFEDKQHGIVVRLQDARDEVLVPFIVDVAVKARKSTARDLGVKLPRPLRIDLVRDLFSLSKLSGLPVEAAETTGTVAVAQWGRVIMITPRATQRGFPWQDTLAHEITHLALSRATRDRAPLWLQEGIAKRQETRWRAARPLDHVPDADQVSKRAMQEGRSIGIDRIGPSIAMLPTPAAASTAFAEVTSFMAYWIRENDEPALHLFLLDLKGMPGANPSAAMRSVTGYPLEYWNARWQKHLKELPAKAAETKGRWPAQKRDPMTLARWVRLSELLHDRQHYNAELGSLDSALSMAPELSSLRFKRSRASLLSGEAEGARQQLGLVRELDAVHGAWFALHGRFLKEDGEVEAAEAAFWHGLGLDPLSEDVACEGQVEALAGQKGKVAVSDPARKALCAAARRRSGR